MSNTLYTPEQAARLAAQCLYGDLTIAGTFFRDYSNDFGGGSGATVNVRVPSALPGRTRPVGSSELIEIDDLNEKSFPVSLTEHGYSAVRLTDADTTLGLQDFTAQVLDPQSRAVRGRAEKAAIAALAGVETLADVSAYDPTDPRATFSAIRKTFRRSGVDAEVPLIAVVGTDVYADLLDADSEPAEKGINAPAVRAFEIHESDKIGPGEIYAYLKTAMVLAVRAPIVPPGAAFGGSVATDVGALTLIRDYDAGRMVETNVLSAFIGASEVPTYVVDEDGTRSQVSGAYRIDTTAARA